MSLFVFRQQSSTGARELADALGGRRLRRFEGGRFFASRARPNPIQVRNGDTIVMWGAHLAGVMAGIKMLNNVQIRSKFTDAQLLARAGVPTVEVSERRPVERQAPQRPAADAAFPAHQQLLEILEDFMEAPLARNDVYRRGLVDINNRVQALNGLLAQPAPVAAPARPAGDWVGRMNDHVGGTDLLNPPAAPDYFVKKIQLVEEYRIHMFCGRSIRAGVKKHREGFANPNPWIRSYDGGWRIVYDDFKSKKLMREVAAKAVKALGLDFGAVDIGKLADGTYIVLEVNRAPGLEGGTVDSYANAITEWSQGRFEVRDIAA